MDSRSFLALDLGAESGRAIVGTLNEGRLTLNEIHRFRNGPISRNDHLHWDVHRLFGEMKQSLKDCIAKNGARPESIGVDSWGVDYALLRKDGSLIDLPFAYRDHRTDGVMDDFFRHLSRKHVYKLTGIQFLQFNTLFQLFAAKRANPSSFNNVTDLLFIPDVFNYFFTGEKKTEFTFATTSQLYNPVKQGWEEELFSLLSIPLSVMQDVVQPGTMIGTVQKSVCAEVGVRELPVVAVASHDTGSAVAAVPAEGDDWAFISSGTWSLMGVEMLRPILSEEALDHNFTNEGGVGGTFQFLQNIMGLWPLQQCRQAWSKERSYSYDELVKMMKAAPAFRSFINPDAQDFFNPMNMPDAIRRFCERSGQPIPQSHGEVVRCILESLALKYRVVLEQLKAISSHRVRKIHVIGGGGQNRALCQFTANATGLPVFAGPFEATAIGNILVQAFAFGYVGSLEEIRKVVRDSFTPTLYEPRQTEEWAEAYDRFLKILQW